MRAGHEEYRNNREETKKKKKNEKKKKKTTKQTNKHINIPAETWALEIALQQQCAANRGRLCLEIFCWVKG